MSTPAGTACLQACPNCAALVDISEQEPLAKFHCPSCGTAMRAARQFNHFSIVESLGAGGMGAVYKALDRNLNRMVALKLLKKEMSADATYIGKLEDEARITASISHPFVVKVFSFGSDFGQYYIAMELVDKGSLDDLMQLQNRVSELQVMKVGLQVASGLQAAHERGLIHRDVKPGNILFADAHTAKITDFGLALLAEQEAESRGEIWGTPYYIAPEKLNNQPEDFRSDIYSLGGTLFHAVAGRPPFEAENASLVALKHLKSRAVSLQAFAPDVSGETAYVINRMLHKDPNQRYASYGELIDHLKYAIDTLQAKTGGPRPVKQRLVLESAQQSSVAGWLTLIMLILLLVAGVLAYTLRDRIFGPAPAPAIQAAVNPAATPDPNAAAAAEYQVARHQIVDDQYATAQEGLAALLKNESLRQPLKDWVRLHHGMAALLNHQDNDARQDFSVLAGAPMYSNADDQRETANFFVNVSGFLNNPDEINDSAINTWNKDTFESLALFLFGLKDWEMGAFDDADKLFAQYLIVKPIETYRWMTDYQPIARRFTHDYDLYAPLHARLAQGGADAAALRADFAQAASQLQTTGKMVDAFFAAQADLNATLSRPAPTPTPPPAPSVAAATPANAPADNAGSPATAETPAGGEDTAARAAETLAWQKARNAYLALAGAYHFEAALAAVSHVPLTDPGLIQARDAMVARARLLTSFRDTLIADLNTRGGYPQAVATRQNVSYPRGIHSATAEALQAATPYGTIAVPWTSFTPETLLRIARYFADATTDPRQAGGREWAAAAFAYETGHVPEAQTLANLAAHNVPGYQSELGLFAAPAAH